MYVTKKKILIVIIILSVISIGVMIYLYFNNAHVKDWVYVNIFNRDITDKDISFIKLSTDKSNQICVYDDYVGILNDKKLNLYNSYGEKITELDININTALYSSCNKYLAIAEDGGNELALILDKTYLWSSTLEGEISQVYVNAGGYVAVVMSDATHKSILVLFNSSGDQLFKSYFTTTRIVDVSISNDNKYIAVGELDTSSTIIQSNIKVISVENAQNNTQNAIIYTYNAKKGKLIIGLKYQQKNQLVCRYDDSIDIIEGEKNAKLLNSNKKNITFMSEKLSNQIAYIEEENIALFKANSKVKVMNTETKEENEYILEDIAKDVYIKDDIIAVNEGTELYFFDTNGWLIKKYTSNKEITDVIVSKNLSAIVYKDKIIIIDL